MSVHEESEDELLGPAEPLFGKIPKVFRPETCMVSCRCCRTYMGTEKGKKGTMKYSICPACWSSHGFGRYPPDYASYGSDHTAIRQRIEEMKEGGY